MIFLLVPLNFAFGMRSFHPAFSSLIPLLNILSDHHGWFRPISSIIHDRREQFWTKVFPQRSTCLVHTRGVKMGLEEFFPSMEFCCHHTFSKLLLWLVGKFGILLSNEGRWNLTCFRRRLKLGSWFFYKNSIIFGSRRSLPPRVWSRSRLHLDLIRSINITR